MPVVSHALRHSWANGWRERTQLAVVPQLLADINASPAVVSVITVLNPRFVELGGIAYFAGVSNNNDIELWRSDGTTAGTSQVKDINPGLSASALSEIVVVGSRLFFEATTASTGELWTSDGTAAGTWVGTLEN